MIRVPLRTAGSAFRGSSNESSASSLAWDMVLPVLAAKRAAFHRTSVDFRPTHSDYRQQPAHVARRSSLSSLSLQDLLLSGRQIARLEER
ncbi:unnamed protein product [Protopolystoma xenopodis]|uniref:Uncharacterized protein n=1 Tax=Protopolystoma xenopodis TaxID=117903 RepID=A0A3S5A7N9_9PLAT|nr:unnamed protein product [Protopolystoma xenopodis]